MADELCSFDGTNKISSDIADMDSGDEFEFEHLSIPCSESASADEADVDTAMNGHAFNSADTRLSLNTAAGVPFELRKPPTVSAASVPSVSTEVCQHTSLKASVVFNELINLAGNLEQHMAAEVEKRTNQVRAEFARQKADYEQKNRVLETKCAGLAAELEKCRKSSSCGHHDNPLRVEWDAKPCSMSDHQKELSSLEETVRQLHLDNDNLVQECNKLQQQVRMLEQQAAEANRQVKEHEDELHSLRAEVSANRVARPQQQHAPTFEPVNHSSVARERPLQTPRVSSSGSPNEWSCPRCTYDNSSSLNKCEICEMPRQSSRTLEC